MVMVHVLHNEFLFGLVWFLFNGDDFFGEGCVSFLVHCLFQDVFLYCIEGIVIGDIHACMSFSGRGFNAHLDS